MKIVLDTNVLLAGVATHGLCEALVLVCLRDHQVYVSQYILTELVRNLRDKFGASEPEALFIASQFREQCGLITPDPVHPDACPDPDDCPVLGTATAAHAGMLVTGDRALLAMKAFEHIPIVSPRECYDRIYR